MKSATNPRLHSAEHSKNLSVARRANGDQCPPEQRYPNMSASGSCVTSIAGPNGMRNCTGDEGRPFEVGNQVLVSSHRKLLSSKAMVVSVAEKPGQDFGRQGLREASASEPLQKCRR